MTLFDRPPSSSPAGPARVFAEYEDGVRYKSALGQRGLYEQSRMNERFFLGDQWHGAHCGSERPLVRYNLIKRIADYKVALVDSGPVEVTYAADGVPDTALIREELRGLRAAAARGDKEAAARIAALTKGSVPDEREVALVLDALSAYYRVTAERVKFADLRADVLRTAYISGTGVLYTWWDDRVPTGLYADEGRRAPIRGDIACEVLDVENVYFGDPSLDDLQEQPFILIAQRRPVEELRREARRFGAAEHEARAIVPDGFGGADSRVNGESPAESGKAVVLTKFWKEWNENGTEYTLRAVRVCRGAVVRPVWEPGVRLYPLTRFCWERARGCAYGDSEITHLIPNQIAINRMITASVWAVMMMGMPIMTVNSDLVTAEVTNDPGQIIPVCGTGEEARSAIQYLDPPDFSPAFGETVDSLITQTLRQAGANEVILGDIRPENNSAIQAVRESAVMPIRQLQERYYSFCEDTARVWAEFWMAHYGRRPLKIRDEQGTWYLPFDAERYRGLLLTARVDVGPVLPWSEEESRRTLDALLERGVLSPAQYLTRLPKGTVPGLERLLAELERDDKTAGEDAPHETASAAR